MKRPETSSYHEWMDQRVEAYVDGDLPEDECERFEHLLSEDEYWRGQVRQARRIQESLHELPQPTTPPALTRSILNHTSRAPQPLSWWKNLLQDVVHTWRALISARQRPVVDYAVGLALVAVGVFFIVVPVHNDSASPSQTASQLNAPVTAPYSDADVERATTKVRWTFDYLSTLGEDASASVEASVRRALLNDTTAAQTLLLPSSSEATPGTTTGDNPSDDDPSDDDSPPEDAPSPNP